MTETATEHVPDTTDAPTDRDAVRQLAEDLRTLDAGDATTNADPPVAAIAEALGDQATQYDAAAAAERRAEQPASKVFDGPYDAQQALDQIFALEDDVDEAQADFDRASKRQKEARDTLNERRDALDKVIKGYRDRTRNVQPDQPVLKTLEDTADETIDERRERIAKEVERVNLFVDPIELNKLSREELDTLDLWVRNPGPIAPELVAAFAHIAGAAEDDRQSCTLCNVTLAPIEGAYPEGAFVGLSCLGKPAEEARPVKKRGTKSKTRKADPDAERQSQKAEGKKKSARKAKRA